MVAKADRMQRFDDLEDERMHAIRQCMRLERAEEAARETISAAVHAYVVIMREAREARRAVDAINKKMDAE